MRYLNEQERVMLDLASGRLRRESLVPWLRQNTKKLDSGSAV